MPVDAPLTTLQTAILLELEQAHTPVLADSLAKKLGVSSGVVRYNIPAINEWLKPRYGKIISRPRFGYNLEVDQQARELLLKDLACTRIQKIYAPSERRQLLLFDLLCSSEYQSFDKLAERVSVSRSTLIRELSLIEDWLAKRQIFLQKRPRLGTRIVGQESTIRHTLVLLIMEIIPEVTLIKLIQWGIDEQNSSALLLHPVQREIIQTLKSLNLQGAMRLLNRIEEKARLRLGDSRFLYLNLYWAVSMFRLEKGQVVSLGEGFDESALSEHEMEVLQIIKHSGSLSGGLVEIPQVEALTFLLEVFSSPPNNTLDNGLDEQKISISSVSREIQASTLAHRLVEQVSKITGREIRNGEILDRLTKHISRMLVRFKHNLPVENPFAADVIRSYPDIWQATVEAVKSLGAEWGNLTQEETAFLAMYFVLARQMEEKAKAKRAPRVIVVCPTGGVSVWMLVSRLKTELPEIEIAANVSLRQITQINRTNVDAIITTARNITDPELPVICVTPFLADEDIRKIKGWFDQSGYRI